MPSLFLPEASVYFLSARRAASDMHSQQKSPAALKPYIFQAALRTAVFLFTLAHRTPINARAPCVRDFFANTAEPIYFMRKPGNGRGVNQYSRLCAVF
ncbi:MAG: hypothetical protein DBY09_06625 [Selenomonadales bacterium]|nr:MAG: hypothetical protein DBY09_06625 [Selenomonadales bacterium]